MYTIGLPQLAAIFAVFGIPIGLYLLFSKRSKRVGDKPYIWGTFLGIISGFWAVVFLLAGVAAEMIAKGPGAAASGIPALTLAILFGAICVGILRRRRYGVILGLGASLLLGAAAGLVASAGRRASSSATYSPVLAVIAIGYLVLVVVNIVYFGKRWKLMGAVQGGERPTALRF